MLLIIALVIDLVKKSEAEGTWQASRFSWRIRSVSGHGVLYLVTRRRFGCCFWCRAGSPRCLISIWFLYRIVRGMVTMNKNQAMEVVRREPRPELLFSARSSQGQIPFAQGV